MSPRKAPKSRPPELDSKPGTFSHTSQRGRRRRANRRNSIARLPRGSSNPSRLPATLKDWQGVPPTRTSIGSGAAWMVVKSPRFGTSGKRCASTADGKASISETNEVRQPSGCQATDAASIPLHTLPNVTSSHSKGTVHRSARGSVGGQHATSSPLVIESHHAGDSSSSASSTRSNANHS